MTLMASTTAERLEEFPVGAFDSVPLVERDFPLDLKGGRVENEQVNTRRQVSRVSGSRGAG